MARRQRISDEAGDAARLTEAADEKLAAATKLAQANSILREQGIEGPAPEPAAPEADPGPSYMDGPLGPSDPAEAKLQSILGKLEGEGKFEVKKHQGSQRSMVGIYNISEWADGSFMESLAHEHKGGTFTVTFKDRFGRIRGQDTMTYDSLSYGKGGSAPAPEGSMFERFLAMMETKEARYQQEMNALRLENQRMMLEMMKTLSGGGGGLLKSSSDVVAIANLFKEQRKAENPLSTLKETVELLHALKEDSPIGEPASPLNTAIDKAFLLLTPILGVWAKKLAGPEGGGPPVALPQGASPAAPALEHTLGMPPAPAPGPALQGPGDAQAPSADPRVASYAHQLLAAAEQKARPEAISGFIIDSVPEEGHEALYEMVADPGLISGLIAAEPKLAAYNGWLISLVRDMKDRLEDAFNNAEEVVEAAPGVEEIRPPVPGASLTPGAGIAGNGGQPEGVAVPKP